LLPVRGSIPTLDDDHNINKINHLRCYSAVIPICAGFEANSIAFCANILQILVAGPWRK
jgi:hypothetical protein